MSLLWKRKCKLTIQINTGEPDALDLSEFKINFRVAQPTVEQPKYAEIYIYNLSQETMNKLADVDNKKTKTKVILEVAYGSAPLEILFKGEVFQYRRGRENGCDTYLCVLAQTGDDYKQNAVINTCIPANTTVDEMGNVLIKEAENYGIDQGYISQLSDQKYPRGRVFFGSLDAHIQQFCNDNNITFSVADDVIHTYPLGGYLLQSTIKIDRTSGMIGMPQLTSEGLNVTSLINPKIQRGSYIEVDLSQMQTQNFDITYGQQKVDQAQKDANTATNKQSYFIVQSVEHVGDTRGDEWYSQMICTAPGAAQPMTGVSITGV